MARITYLTPKRLSVFLLTVLPIFYIFKLTIEKYNVSPTTDYFNDINNKPTQKSTYNRLFFSGNSPENPYPINPRAACLEKSQVELVICVSVSRSTFNARRVIRETWGKYANVSENRVLLLFFVGLGHLRKNQSDDIEKQLKSESQKYNDIVEGNFVDSYRNLTLKSISALRWVDRYCSRADFMMKIDADVYVNIPNLLKQLRIEQEKNKHAPFVLGLKRGHSPVRRHYGNKWRVTKEEYANDTYPTYLDGAVYSMNRAAYEGIARVTYGMKPFWIEDVFITGVCGQRAGVTLVNSPRQYRMKLKGGDPCEKLDLISTHGFNPAELLAMYWKMTNAKCG